jgi:hypothetical protein
MLVTERWVLYAERFGPEIDAVTETNGKDSTGGRIRQCRAIKVIAEKRCIQYTEW